MLYVRQGRRGEARRAGGVRGGVGREVEAGTEGIAGACEGDDPDIVVNRGIGNGAEDAPGELLAEGVLHLGAVEGDRADVAGIGSRDLRHGWAPGLLVGGVYEGNGCLKKPTGQIDRKACRRRHNEPSN